mmetsp:Transcript_14912/g.27280  ORF Transcript_14912/g.27280 Transcript_14912/m.27280 type:complete len:94 (-) Transcript_14912:37-318(-)
MMSGQSTLVATPAHLGEGGEFVLRRSCKRLGIEYNSNDQLMHGELSVPVRADVREWPGDFVVQGNKHEKVQQVLPADRRRIIEYQLVRAPPIP